MIKCNSPFTLCGTCVIDSHKTSDIHCNIAKDLDFQREKILTHCKYAKPSDIKNATIKELFS